MNEIVKKYLEAKKEETKKKHEEKKAQKLLELGICEKEYELSGSYNADYTYWDPENQKYYKKVPIEVSDEEYDEILKYSGDKDEKSYNIIANVLIASAWVIIVGGFILGLYAGFEVGSLNNLFSYSAYNKSEFSFLPAIICWIIAYLSGISLLGFAEIIQLLQDIKNKQFLSKSE